jgi:menaquinone-dependent protoporphyrinogen oxidase
MLIIYATREGHTRRVAEFLAEAFRNRGMFVEMADAAHVTADIELRADYDAVIVAGSVHVSLHEPELVRFVKQHRFELEQLPAAFVSVSMSQAVLESTSTTRKQREEAAVRVDAAFALFNKETGWVPRRTLAVPGALLYRHYGPVTRLIMRAVAHASGNPTDVTRNHVLTNWSTLTRFADDFMTSLVAGQLVPVAS